MPKPSEAHIEVSKRILTHQRAGNVHEPDAAAAGRAYQALFRTLTPIIGEAGAYALFVRSMTLAKAEFPDFAEVALPTAPALSDPNVAACLVGCLGDLDAAVGSGAAVSVFAIYLRLLTNFLGEPLVWQILQSAFPGTDRTPSKEAI